MEHFSNKTNKQTNKQINLHFLQILKDFDTVGTVNLLYFLLFSDSFWVAMAGCRTRHQSGNDVVGPSAELPQADLPTMRDVLAFGLLLKENSLERKNQMFQRELSKKICSGVKEVWARANHKLLAPDVVYLDQNIENKFIEDWKLMGLVKSKKLSKEKEASWRAKLDMLF